MNSDHKPRPNKTNNGRIVTGNETPVKKVQVSPALNEESKDVKSEKI